MKFTDNINYEFIVTNIQELNFLFKYIFKINKFELTENNFNNKLYTINSYYDIYKKYIKKNNMIIYLEYNFKNIYYIGFDKYPANYIFFNSSNKLRINIKEEILKYKLNNINNGF